MFLKIRYEPKDLYITGVISDDGDIFWKAVDLCKILQFSTAHKSIFNYVREEKIFRLNEITRKTKQSTIVLTYEQGLAFLNNVPDYRKCPTFTDWFVSVNCGTRPLYPISRQDAVATTIRDYLFFNSTDESSDVVDTSLKVTLLDILKDYRKRFLKKIDESQLEIEDDPYTERRLIIDESVDTRDVSREEEEHGRRMDALKFESPPKKFKQTIDDSSNISFSGQDDVETTLLKLCPPKNFIYKDKNDGNTYKYVAVETDLNLNSSYIHFPYLKIYPDKSSCLFVPYIYSKK